MLWMYKAQHVKALDFVDFIAADQMRRQCLVCEHKFCDHKNKGWDRRDVCFLGTGLLLVKCLECAAEFTVCYSPDVILCMAWHEVTDDEIRTIPGLPENWGVPF